MLSAKSRSSFSEIVRSRLNGLGSILSSGMFIDTDRNGTRAFEVVAGAAFTFCFLAVTVFWFFFMMLCF